MKAGVQAGSATGERGGSGGISYQIMHQRAAMLPSWHLRVTKWRSKGWQPLRLIGFGNGCIEGDFQTAGSRSQTYPGTRPPQLECLTPGKGLSETNQVDDSAKRQFLPRRAGWIHNSPWMCP